MRIGNLPIRKSSTIYTVVSNIHEIDFSLFLGTFGRMDNIQFWIWLAVIVITFLARAGKKKKEGPLDPAGEEDQPKPMSFEDLLREIQASKQPAVPRPAPAAGPPAQQHVDYDDDLQEETKPLETIRPDYRSDDSIYETYEKAKREAFNRQSLEETAKLEDTVVRFDAFAKYKKRKDEKVLISRYLKDFQDPEGFKKAFVMSEILKRKF